MNSGFLLWEVGGASNHHNKLWCWYNFYDKLNFNAYPAISILTSHFSLPASCFLPPASLGCIKSPSENSPGIYSGGHNAYNNAIPTVLTVSLKTGKKTLLYSPLIPEPTYYTLPCAKHLNSVTIPLISPQGAGAPCYPAY